LLARAAITEKQRELAGRIFRRVALAEAAVHGVAVDKVHFHEVGALDSIADIIGAAIGLDLVGAERFTSRSVPTGHGTVHAAHGLMPIPAPGTAELLKGAPLAPSTIQAELTTPTGAAILTTVVSEWTETPAMTIESIGHGAGTMDLKEQPNLLRLFVGTTTAAAERDQAWVLETNLDDLAPEIIGYCYDLLFQAGALDVWTQPLFMKKNRPAILLGVLAPESQVSTIEEILFRETTALGVRRYAVERKKLERRPHEVQTRFGLVMGKLGWLPGRAPWFAPEYEACARVARESGVPLRQVYEEVRQAYLREGGA
jgi:hypothetical protein